MPSPVIRVEDLSKLYRLGQIGTGSLAHDINRWWHRFRGREDPYSRIGQTNDRTKTAESNWVWALRDVNFDVHRGEVLGIVGRNGAGKSTLLKVLSRVTAPTTGQIKIRGRIASLLEVGTGFHPELTGRENIYLNGAILGMRRHEIRRKLDDIVDFSGCTAYLDTPVKRYSSGMYVRLAFSVAAHLDPEILIVDEVLAVGDADFQKSCLGKMREISSTGERTVLFVSHNLASVQQLCSSVMVVNNGTIHFTGSTEAGLKQYNAIGSDSQRPGTALPSHPLPPSALGQIKETWIEDETGQRISRFGVGAPIRIRIRFTLFSFNLRYSLAIGLYDAMGTPLVHFDTISNPPESTPAGHEFLSTCNIPALNLYPGEHHLNFSLRESNGSRIHRIECGCRFTVVETDFFHSGKLPAREGSKFLSAHRWTIHEVANPKSSI